MPTDSIIPPHDHDAEQGVIGSLLADPAACAPLLGRLLSADDFHLPAHQTLYTAALALWQASGALDIILLTNALRDAGTLAAIGGPSYVATLYGHTPTAANVEHYAGIVREKSSLRRLWQAARAVQAAALGHDADPTSLAADLARTLATLAAQRPRAALTMREHMRAATDRWEAAVARGGALPEGILSTGLSSLDAVLEGGLHPGDLVIVAAETSGGKTALAMQITARAAIEHDAQVMVASYEMPAHQLVDRLTAVRSGVPSSALRAGLLNEGQFRALQGALPLLSGAGIHLRDAIGHWTVDDVAAEARAIRAQHGLGLLVVDYLQLAAPRMAPKGAQRNREREVAEISRALKGLAVELGVTVVALSQLNEDGRLRESRAIGQDADVVLIIGEHPDAGEDRRQIRIEKNRHGARDKHVTVAWDGPLMRFDSIGKAEQQQEAAR